MAVSGGQVAGQMGRKWAALCRSSPALQWPGVGRCHVSERPSLEVKREAYCVSPPCDQFLGGAAPRRPKLQFHLRHLKT